MKWEGRSVAESVRRIRALPVPVVAAKLVGYVGRRGREAWCRRVDRRRPSYSGAGPERPRPLVLDAPSLRAAAADVEDLHRHTFNLLGSGPVQVRHGITCAGFDGTRFPSGPEIDPDADGAWLDGRIPAANVAQSRAIWAQVSKGYVPIDWQLDFRSGYRWTENTWYRDIRYGHVRGADVKVPWELGRLQHLPALAIADPSPRGLREVQDQLLDFIATNPPRFGVQWACTMDVAIRAANMVLAHDLASAAGRGLDVAARSVVVASVHDHARHIWNNFEWAPEIRGNHYLANVAGLAFISAWLPPTVETDRCLAFAASELSAELLLQFGKDGANFEGSTCYHRLSMELAVYAVAALLSVSTERWTALAHRFAKGIRSPSHLAAPLRLEDDIDGVGPASPVSREAFNRIAGMVAFAEAVTKPDGRVAQIGDNDSGRFFRPYPTLDAGGGENSLDHRRTIAAARALVSRPSSDECEDGALVRAIARQRACPSASAFRLDGRFPSLAARSGGPERIARFRPGSGSLRSGVRIEAYPEFGLYVWRSKRLFLSIRCGPTGQRGRGGHDHNDQLAVELQIDGVDWIVDPGTAVYTSSPQRRNAYRSVRAHWAPQADGREPRSLAEGLFVLGPGGDGHCRHYSAEGFEGWHEAFGTPWVRSLRLEDDAIVVIDRHTSIVSNEELLVTSPLPPPLPFSPGYGRW